MLISIIFNSLFTLNKASLWIKNKIFPVRNHHHKHIVIVWCIHPSVLFYYKFLTSFQVSASFWRQKAVNTIVSDSFWHVSSETGFWRQKPNPAKVTTRGLTFEKWHNFHFCWAKVTKLHYFGYSPIACQFNDCKAIHPLHGLLAAIESLGFAC